MKNLILTIALALASINIASAQKYLTQNGKIDFHSKATLENIEAVNNQVSSVINSENGEIAFSLLMKAFLFEKALMQEHFNEKYVESEKFPKAKFKGTIQNFNLNELSQEWKTFKVKGSLTIHGVTKEVVEEIKLRMHNDEIECESSFKINLDDYEVKIPSAVKENISNTIDINLDMKYQKVK